jgi:hypothetical protein
MLRNSLAWASLLGLAGAVSASPLYYTFTGAVSGYYTDGPGGFYSETSNNFSLGQEVSFVFMVDADLPGYSTYAGNQYNLSDDDWGHYFYSTYAGGSAVAIDPATTIGPGSSYFAYSAANQSGVTGSNGDLTGYDNVRVDNYNRAFSQWTTGMAGFAGQNIIFSGSGTREFNYFSLTLSGISDTRPATEAVPEPGTLALLGLGCLGLAAARKRRGCRS